MEKAHELLTPYGHDGYRNVVYIVSDGIETCEGNPVEATEAGGDNYATVRDQSRFEDILLKKWKPSYMQVWGQQGVSLRDLVTQMTGLQEIYGCLLNVSDREAGRVSSAVRFLRGEKLISDEDAQSHGPCQ